MGWAALAHLFTTPTSSTTYAGGGGDDDNDVAKGLGGRAGRRRRVDVDESAAIPRTGTVIHLKKIIFNGLGSFWDSMTSN